jgi:hypothetical protein
MMVRRQFLLLFIFTLRELSSHGQFHLYQTDTLHGLDDYDCLDYYALDDIANMNEKRSYRQGHQIIPFCRRDGKKHGDELDKQFSLRTVSSSPFTFEQLRGGNVTSAQLYAWAAPIDSIEQYEAFVRGNDEDGRTTLFYNCSSFQQFGRSCEYSFLVEVSFVYFCFERFCQMKELNFISIVLVDRAITLFI